MVEWLDWVIRIVGAHEESHLVGVPKNYAPDKHYAPDKLAIVTAEAHRSVDPLWHLNIVLPLGVELQVHLRT
jgi:hypothetical protein